MMNRLSSTLANVARRAPRYQFSPSLRTTSVVKKFDLSLAVSPVRSHYHPFSISASTQALSNAEVQEYDYETDVEEVSTVDVTAVPEAPKAPETAALDPVMGPSIIVCGVGGAGGNAINNMIASQLEGVEFLACNTDAQAIKGSLSNEWIQLGSGTTKGLGAGANPNIGRDAAEESTEEIKEKLKHSHMVFITAGMGGGTGTGAAPVIARVAREMGLLTVGVVSKPFGFEGKHRMKLAEDGLLNLREHVDTLIVVPNQNLMKLADKRTSLLDAFRLADNVLYAGVRSITDLMVRPGLINLDFADVTTVMKNAGSAMMGSGQAEGEDRAVLAAEHAINNPLLEEMTLQEASGVLVNVAGGEDMTLFEVDQAAQRIGEEVSPNANIIFGSTFDESMNGQMRVSVVVTGIQTEA